MMADLKQHQFVGYGESMGIGIQEIETHLLRNFGDTMSVIC